MRCRRNALGHSELTRGETGLNDDRIAELADATRLTKRGASGRTNTFRAFSRRLQKDAAGPGSSVDPSR